MYTGKIEKNIKIKSSPKEFAGDKKFGISILGKIESKFVKKYTPHIPKFIETYHLTYLTIIWSLGIILFGFLAHFNINWLWCVSILIFLQWLTDLFDGAVGRFRKTGLIKWGYYMDHFLDYIFLSSILIGYSFIISDNFKYLFFFIFMIFVGFMINSYLYFAITNKFRISYFGFGPTEIRLIFIILNILIIIFGKTYMSWSLPYVLIISLLALIIVVFDTQKHLWKDDMKSKNISK